jgi:valyl-tRNA synthetase
MIAKYNADCLRFWAASSKLGDDLPFLEKELLTGQKFMTKLWNASKFVFMHLEDFDPKAKKPSLSVVDRWLLAKLKKVVDSASESFERYEYSHTKAETEKFFWQVFCDYYMEMVKHRLYKPEEYGAESRRAVQYTLYHTLLTVLKLVAPIMPHITEEVYQGCYKNSEGIKSIHNAAWPSFGSEFVDEKAEACGDLAADLIAKVRKTKSDMNIPLGAEIQRAILKVPKDKKPFVDEVLEDIRGTGKIKEIEVVPIESGDLEISFAK